MKICMLQYEHDLPDLRLESEARRLALSGHKIVIVCKHLNYLEHQMGIQNISVVRLKLESTFLQLINRIIFLLFLIDCVWFLTLINLHRRHRFDVFHIRDIPLARTVQILAGLLNRRVVLDLYENYPVVMQSFWPLSMDWAMRTKKRIFFSLSRWKRYECSVLRWDDEIIVVVEEAKMRIVLLGVPEKRITIVGNTLKNSFMSYPKKDPQLEKQYAEKLVLSYLGSIYLSVAIDTVIEAMPNIISAVPNAHLLVVGESTRFQEFQQMAEKLSVEDHVTFESWQPLFRIPAYMAVSSVGLFPFKPDEHHNSTVYNKLFQYMYMRCPVLVSDCKPAARIVTESKCGWVIKGEMDNPSLFGENAIALLKNHHLRYDMGLRGHKTVLAKYRWTKDGDRLAELYKRIEGRCSASM